MSPDGTRDDRIGVDGDHGTPCLDRHETEMTFVRAYIQDGARLSQPKCLRDESFFFAKLSRRVQSPYDRRYPDHLDFLAFPPEDPDVFRCRSQPSRSPFKM